MHGLDRRELVAALAYLAGALPYEPKWVALATADGRLIGQYLAWRDGARVATMIRASEALNGWLSHDMDGGFRFYLHAGTEGMSLILPLGETYRVVIHMTGVESLDAVIAGLNEGIVPLMDLLA